MQVATSLLAKAAVACRRSATIAKFEIKTMQSLCEAQAAEDPTGKTKEVLPATKESPSPSPKRPSNGWRSSHLTLLAQRDFSSHLSDL